MLNIKCSTNGIAAVLDEKQSGFCLVVNMQKLEPKYDKVTGVASFDKTPADIAKKLEIGLGYYDATTQTYQMLNSGMSVINPSTNTLKIINKGGMGLPMGKCIPVDVDPKDEKLAQASQALSELLKKACKNNLGFIEAVQEQFKGQIAKDFIAQKTLNGQIFAVAQPALQEIFKQIIDSNSEAATYVRHTLKNSTTTKKEALKNGGIREMYEETGNILVSGDEKASPISADQLTVLSELTPAKREELGIKYLNNPKAVKEFDTDIETNAFIVEESKNCVLVPANRKADEELLVISGITDVRKVVKGKDISFEFLAKQVTTYSKSENAAEAKSTVKEDVVMSAPARTNGLFFVDACRQMLPVEHCHNLDFEEAPSAPSVTSQSLFAPKAAASAPAPTPASSPSGPAPSM